MRDKDDQSTNPSRLAQQESSERVWRILRDQKNRENEKAHEAIRILRIPHIPTPYEVRAFIFTMIGSERQRILSNHCYWKEKKLREGLSALVGTASTAYVDLCRHDAALTALSKQKHGSRDHVEHAAESAAQKDLMAFCAAAFAIIDTTRRVKASRPDIAKQIQDCIIEYFNNDQSLFIKDLRKNLSHGSVYIPNTVVNIDFYRNETTSAMTFQKFDLLYFGEWCTEARRYISNHDSSWIKILDPIRCYFECLNTFYSRINDLFAMNVTDAERDYFDIEDEFRRWASRQHKKILISQIGKGKNPYDYLHHFFRPEEVRAIRRHPDHSKEQVDYIISLRAVETDCDADLRQEMYRLFSVPPDS